MRTRKCKVARVHHAIFNEASSLFEFSRVHFFTVMIKVIIFRRKIIKAVCLFLWTGLMKFLGKGTTGKIIEETDEKMDRLLKTFKDNLQNKYNRYAFIFFFCEVLNLIVVVSQFFITDTFLQHQFLFYGPKVWL